MQPGLVVKLRPSGPWRIGPDSGARNQVDAIYHSDSLYGAVTSAMARLGSLDQWLAATVRGERPAVCFSSCFPFLDEIGFVVPPRSVWPPSSPALLSARVRWKSARFVPLGIVQAILGGQRLDGNEWAIDGPSECLVPAGRPGPFRTGVRWNAAVDRLSGAAERHSTACLEFRPGAGLWTIAEFAGEAARDQWMDRVKAAFRLLADSGFGGERSRGWGRAEAPEFVEGRLPEMILGPMETRPRDKGIQHPAPAAEAAAVSQPPTAEAPAARQSPTAETPAASQSPVADAAAAGQPPAADVAAASQPPETEAGAASQPPPAEAPAASQAPVADAAAAGQPPAAESPAASQPPETEAGAAEMRSGPDVLPMPRLTPPAEPSPAPPIPQPEPELPPADPDPGLSPLAPAPEPAFLEPERAAGIPAPEPSAAPEPPPAPVPHWLLSLFTPAPGDAVDWARGCYTVLTRGGRVDSPAGSGELKRQLNMVAEGSVLYAASTLLGSAPDVAPEGFAHPVFRAGFAVSIPLPGTEAAG